MDDRYGTNRRASRDEVLGDIVAGALEGLRVTRRYVLTKCQDQVEGGRVRWQSDLLTRTMEDASARKVDVFHLVTTPRPQPGDRRQRTARRNYSSLLVFEKGRG